MPRGNWRAILATIGVIAFLGLSVETGKLYYASAQRQSDYNYQPASHTRLDKPMTGEAQPQGYQPHCEDPNTNSDADLCAQWAAVQQVGESNRMASLNLRFTLFSLWATVIATIVLLWTLIETMTVSRRELRAYLFVDGVAIGDGTHHPDRNPDLMGIVGSALGVKNSGGTPAHQVVHWSGVDIAYFDKEGEMRAPSKLDTNFTSNVPPNGTITADRVMSRKPTQKMVAAIKAGKAAVFVFGAIEYKDVFDTSHRTDYRLYFCGAWPPPLAPNLRFSTTGNTAT